MKDWNSCPGGSTDPDVAAGFGEDASGLFGTPGAVVRARDRKDVQEAMRWAWAHNAPVLPVGGQTSTTGSAVPLHGELVLSMRAMGEMEWLDASRIRVGAGANLGSVKRELAERGCLLPPDPTSENDCTVGGAVATNASGPRSLKYGATRPYVQGLEVVLPDGQFRRFERRNLEKDTTGYGFLSNPVDWFVGAEGTLGVVTSIDFLVVPAPEKVLSFFAYFPTLSSAVLAVQWLRGVASAGSRPGGPWGKISPRCIELFDRAALDIISEKASGVGVTVPEEAQAMLFLEQESDADSEEGHLEAWFEVLMAITPLAEDVTVAENASRQRILRDLRHHVPATMNEVSRGFRSNGGRKVSTDWAVPLHRLPEAIERASVIGAAASPFQMVRYGHIGNGHPHFNLLAADSTQLERALKASKEMAKMAISLGGTAAAEHGLGKLKTEFLAWVHPPEVVQLMKMVKQHFDPRGILSPGNLFPG